MDYRIEHDSMGEVKVPADKYWGAQTERSHENFPIGVGLETMPREITRAFGVLKLAAARANHALKPEKMTDEKLAAIEQAATEVMEGKLFEHFPLVVWQTGSGTQSNMNANEVIANRGNEIAGKKLLHPNDDINMSQSSNDTFPTAMHIAAVEAIEEQVLPAVDKLTATLRRLEAENEGVVKSGRTHLQDATPIKFSQEISGWRSSLEKDRQMLLLSLDGLRELALGGTAVGTGINASAAYIGQVVPILSGMTGISFTQSPDLVDATQNTDCYLTLSAALKSCAASLSKMCNDLRLMSSGPRDGLGEISLPARQNGSSIMPGKVNPVIPEVVNQIAFRVIGYDATVTLAVEGGQLELNAFEPVIFDSLYQGMTMLRGGVHTLIEHCLRDLRANEEICRQEVERSVGVVTALCPRIGYNAACSLAREALRTKCSVRELALSRGLLTAQELNALLDPAAMTCIRV